MKRTIKLFLLLAILTACSQTPTPAATTTPPALPTQPYPAPEPTATPAGYPAPAPLPTTEPYPAATAVNDTAVLAPTIPHYTYQVIHAYPHDPNAFTQGLVYEDGIFYEGTGLRGQSSLRRVDVASGEVQQIISLDEQYFGEGIVAWENRIIQLTWQGNTGFVYDKTSFEQLQAFNYPTEGWGITHDGQKLIMSDGTATLYFWDPETLAEIGRVDVFDENGPVVRLNELEYVEGEVWANVWQTNLIARIDPATGQVVGWIDLTGLLDTAVVTQQVDVLNGIAYDAATDRLFVTGKLWPQVYEIELIPVE
jgi:glutaminyl-peptide cyclotransferase